MRLPFSTPKSIGWFVVQIIILAFAIFGMITAVVLLVRFLTPEEIPTRHIVEEQPETSVELLTVNSYSRPAVQSDATRNIVIHYTANPGTTAEQNREYFEGLKDSHETHASSHFIVGLDGEIIQCIPTAELAYAVGDRNRDTVSIEVCHPDETGQFTEATYASLVYLTAWLCGYLDLEPEDVIRHHDITGKNCPKYYVENPESWEQFIEDVRTFILENGTPYVIEEEE